MTPHETLKSLMKVALQAANPYRKTFASLPERPSGRLYILSVGKAAAPMARAAADFYGQSYEGILYAPKGYGKKVKGLETWEGSHPVPSALNVEITKRITRAVESLGPDDMLLALISGGTSALLSAPFGFSLSEKIAETERLLKSGQGIATINARREEMSAVKGGKLAKMAHPAKVVTLIVSDVAGDDPNLVGSAPTGGGDIVLSANHMLAAVKGEAEAIGISVNNLGQLEGEARVLALDHTNLALNYHGERPHLILSGGETTVTVKGKGKGGRNSEYALALAITLEGAPGIYGLAIDSDGHDGTGPFAGAEFDPHTLLHAVEKGLIHEKLLNNNDSGSFFKAINGLINTGPTLTNLNDLRMILLV
ncbi:MAG: glycerate kinase type-2 family protein [Alphaproteobacteria bacterium]